MSKHVNTIAVLGIFFALFLCAATTSYAQSAKPTADVNVVNTPSFNVANTPNVNVANTPSVSVVNTDINPVLVRDANDPARHAFHRSLTIVLSPGEVSGLPKLIEAFGKNLGPSRVRPGLNRLL
jgi:hypothetical protein